MNDEKLILADDRAAFPKRSRIGMPGGLYLDEFGAKVRDAFGEFPYQVGSSIRGDSFRDVDVRLMLDDADYEAMFPGVKERTDEYLCAKWVVLCQAFSELGHRMTGLPIDFQIQRASEANRLYPDGPRSALGILRRLREGGSRDAT